MLRSGQMGIDAYEKYLDSRVNAVMPPCRNCGRDWEEHTRENECLSGDPEAAADHYEPMTKEDVLESEHPEEI